MQGYLNILKERGEDSPFLESLLEGFPTPGKRGKPGDQALLDPLSDRELEVLQMLSSNLTTPELADELVLSVNTVRTHIKNIYHKLDAHKRSEAVRKAHDLNLIEPL